jgi:hypothetical protein
MAADGRWRRRAAGPQGGPQRPPAQSAGSRVSQPSTSAAAMEPGDKRKSGGKSNSNGRKKFRQTSVSKGCGGILFSCDQHREREAVAEGYDLLHDYADELFPADGVDSDSDPTEAEGGSSNASMSSILAAEIAAVKQSSKKESRRFSLVDTVLNASQLVYCLV